MAKSLKLNIKNTQLAEAINLRGLKAKLSRKKETVSETEKAETAVEERELPLTPVGEVESAVAEEPAVPTPLELVEETLPVFHEEALPQAVETAIVEPEKVSQPRPGPLPVPPTVSAEIAPKEPAAPKPFLSAIRINPEGLGPVLHKPILPPKPSRKPSEALVKAKGAKTVKPPYEPLRTKIQKVQPKPKKEEERPAEAPPKSEGAARQPAREPKVAEKVEKVTEAEKPSTWKWQEEKEGEASTKFRRSEGKPKPKPPEGRGFGKRGEPFGASKVRGGISLDEEETTWRRRRPKTKVVEHVQEVVRPTRICVRLPISVKDLAAEMKLKSSQLISALFLQGTVVTLNDLLTDEIMVQLLGQGLGCEIEIDTKEERRLRITDKSVLEEVRAEKPEDCAIRPPVVAFMGHVDHGKTSLIDTIRKSNRAQFEIGAITQHIGAFLVSTSQGQVTIIDTPGHEAFSAMRERGANVTDIVVLVIAGDEGIKEQTVEVLKQAKEAHATIIVAMNKCDKPSFDQERVFRQLADHEMLPEAWGGHTITVRCSALTGEGVPELLEMIALQSEVLELRANPKSRARGMVLESEMSRGLGPVTTVLVQNGTLHLGDSLVFATSWARVKSMRDDSGNEVNEAGPSVPVRVNGLSGLPSAGEEFIVVKSEKEAKEIAEGRREGIRQQEFQLKRRLSLENMMEKASGAVAKKILNVVLRADVQGSLDALKTGLSKIQSQKVDLNIISFGVGEITESDIQLAATSKAVILGFHTSIEAHAEPMVKEWGIPVKLHSIIYHAQDEVRELMRSLLDKIPEEVDRGKAEVRATFKSSQLGIIAGCFIVDGSITRSCHVRVRRGKEILHTGPINSLKRIKEDIKEASKGTECGILLQGFSSFEVGDILEAYEIVYHEQEL